MELNLTTLKSIEPVVPQLTKEKQKFKILVQILDQNNIEETLKSSKCSQNLVGDLKANKSYWYYCCCDESQAYTKIFFTYAEIKYECETERNDSLRGLGATIATELTTKKEDSFDLKWPSNFNEDAVGVLLNGIIVNNYKFEMRNADENDTAEVIKKKFFQPILKINLCHENLTLDKGVINYYLNLANANLWTKNIGNLRANYATTEYFLEISKEIAKLENVELKYFVGEDLLKEKLNLVYNVGKGSKTPPIMINLFYKGKPDQPEKVTALIGKGVVFDAGGINIKGSGAYFLEVMYIDKCGATDVLGVFKTVAAMKLPINLTCTVSCVQNFLGCDAYRPSDILTSYKGITVEIGNTDAEGRLVLADALSWTQKKYKPHTIIDVATLTGAAMVSLGLKMGALFSNNDDLSNNLIKSAKNVDEPFWRLPITTEHRNLIKGKQGEIKNIGGQFGGACTAAAFLECFIEKGTNWAHLDIAGPAFDQGTASCTGFSTQLLIDYLYKNNCQ